MERGDDDDNNNKIMRYSNYKLLGSSIEVDTKIRCFSAISET